MLLKLGAHFSIAGGHFKALLEAALLKCTALQIFTRNQNQWKAKPLDEEGIQRFKSERARLGIEAILAHDSYLINLGSPDSILWKKSLHAFIDEMDRAEHLGIEYLVFHPGSHTGSGEEKCIAKIAEGLNRALEARSDYAVMLLLETTAGQGTNVGYKFEHMREIIDKVDDDGKLGICFDTAHSFAAGYELRTRDGYEETWLQFEDVIGLDRLKAFHLNDSKKDLGSRVDRHENIGHGFLGKKPFEYILNDERFDGLVGCLETPKEGDWDRKNLTTLRRLVKMPCGSTRKPTVKKATPKKAVAKKTVKKAAPKKRVTAKATAKKTVKKAAPKKKVAPKKKATVKKAAPKKKATATAKKKVTARKPAAKKTTTRKKVTARKPAARRTTAKKK